MQIDRINGLVGSIAIKAPVLVATTANITLSGEQTIDGITTSESRVLVKDQTDTTENGIYDSSSGAWTRSADFDGARDVEAGTVVYVQSGTVSAGFFYEQTTADPVIGTTAITFSVNNFSGKAHVFSNAGLQIEDTDASHVLILKPGSDLTADRIFTLVTGDSARTLTLSGNPTLGDWFDQSVKTGASPTFAGQTLTGLQTLKTGANIASAATIDLTAATGNLVHVTGTVATSAVTMTAGQHVEVIADAAWPLTYNATTNKINTNGASVTLAAGDRVLYYSDGTTVFGTIRKNDGSSLSYGKAVAAPSYYATGAVATGTTVFPEDNTIPQNTEGDQYMSTTHTPISATNILVVEVCLFASHSASTRIGAALFQDTTANALCCAYQSGSAAGVLNNLKFTHYMVAGTTSQITFKVRVGSNLAGTTTFNGSGGTGLFGGVLCSSISITEYKA